MSSLKYWVIIGIPGVPRFDNREAPQQYLKKRGYKKGSIWSQWTNGDVFASIEPVYDDDVDDRELVLLSAKQDVDWLQNSCACKKCGELFFEPYDFVYSFCPYCGTRLKAPAVESSDDGNNGPQKPKVMCFGGNVELFANSVADDG